jgi:peptidoglycan hydrolase CwlO-like protein
MAEYAMLKSVINKTNMKTKIIGVSQAAYRRVRLSALALIAAVVVMSGVVSQGFGVFAASCSSISDCQQQIANDSNAIANLEDEATSYQDAISKLQAQINSIQQEIALNTSKQTQLEAEIIANQAKLELQKQALGQNLKAMYVSDQMSTVEMLATWMRRRTKALCRIKFRR